MSTDNIDLEKNVISASSRPAIPSWASSAVGMNDHSFVHTPLQLFQLLVGIHTPPSLIKDEPDVGKPTSGKLSRGRSENIGLYRRTKELERQGRLKYQCTSFISNFLYMLQIVLAATFTALSAYKNSNPVTLTVLGAFATVVAGSLAWQKGQGVPHRYRKAMDQYQALIFEIEMSERSFFDMENSHSEDGLKLDPRAEKARLQKLFDTARADEQANYPDLYVSTSGTTAKQHEEPAK